MAKITQVLQLVLVTVCLASFGAIGTAQAQDDVYVLRYGTLDGPDTIIGRAQAWYLNRVEELSEGRITFEPYWSQSLVPARELLDALNTGVADVSFLIPGYFPGKLPLLTVATLPTTHADAYTFGMAVHDLVAEMPAVSEEMAQWDAVYLTSAPFPPFNILSKEPIDSVDDLEGMKVRSFAALAALVSRFGAVAVSLPTPEVYTALQRGTVDAATYPPLLIADFKLHETAKYLWAQPFGTVVSVIAIRKSTYDKLPDDLKKILKDTAAEHQVAYHRILQIEGNEGSAVEELEAANVKITPANDEAKALIDEQMQPIWEEWIAEMEGKGLPGQEVADKYRELLEKHSKSVPK